MIKIRILFWLCLHCIILRYQAGTLCTYCISLLLENSNQTVGVVCLLRITLIGFSREYQHVV